MRVRIIEKELLFRTPFIANGLELGFRKVMYLHLYDDRDGIHGYGEAAPLEEFGTESYSETLTALTNVLPILEKIELTPNTIRDLDELFPDLFETPTARFAMETSLLDLIANRNNIPLCEQLEIINGGVSFPAAGEICIPVNAVLSGGTEARLVQSALTAVSNGFTCLKIKAGMDAPDDEIARIAAVRAAVGPDVLLRVDANGAWNQGTALKILEDVCRFNIEYVEQPVSFDDSRSLQFVTAHSPIAIAADEAAQSVEDAMELLVHDACNLLVVKPMFYGSLLTCRELALAAAHFGKDIVFTSVFDSAIGRHAVAHLVASLDSSRRTPMRHHGLATGGLFVRDLAPEIIRNGMLIIPRTHGLGIPVEIKN